MVKIGVTQGRLSPRPEGEERLQFFPSDWQSEFRVAREMGFDCVEWLFDWDKFGKNPFFREDHTEEIRSVSRASGVEALSTCSDYFMKYALVGRDPEIVQKELIWQMRRASALGQNLILVPLLEDHAVKSEAEKQEIISVVTQAIHSAQDHKVRIAFETELPVAELIDFIDRFQNPRVGVYYDIGNSTSYGFDCPKDLEILSGRVSGVHIKDRKVGSTQSVVLGSGDADFKNCFVALSRIGYNGTYILQAWRGEDYLADAKKQLEFVRQIIGKI